MSEEEKDDLLPVHLTTKAELNEFEQANILEAHKWLISYKLKTESSDPRFLKILHRRMFNQTWKSAGDYKKTEKNIGVRAVLIPTEMDINALKIADSNPDQIGPLLEFARS